MKEEKQPLHTAYPKPDPYGALNMPLYLTAAYEFDSAEAIAFNSGMAAITNALLTVASAGSNIIPSPHFFGTFTEELRRQMDVRDTTIRFSVGLEDAEDLIHDIEGALKG